MEYKISKNNDGTSSAIYKHIAVSGDIAVTYVPDKDYYIVETPGPRSAKWIVPSDLLDALYNSAWEDRQKPNANGWYLCCSHDYESRKEPCPECQENKHGS